MAFLSCAVWIRGCFEKARGGSLMFASKKEKQPALTSKPQTARTSSGELRNAELGVKRPPIGASTRLRQPALIGRSDRPLRAAPPSCRVRNMAPGVDLTRTQMAVVVKTVLGSHFGW